MAQRSNERWIEWMDVFHQNICLIRSFMLSSMWFDSFLIEIGYKKILTSLNAYLFLIWRSFRKEYSCGLIPTDNSNLNSFKPFYTYILLLDSYQYPTATKQSQNHDMHTNSINVVLIPKIKKKIFYSFNIFVCTTIQTQWNV